MDFLGHLLRVTPDFRGKRRFLHFWMQHRHSGDERKCILACGARIFCDMSHPYERMIWLRKEESADLAALRRLLRPGETFVDCGANIGLWTLTAATAVGTTGRVFAFEPNPSTYEKLLRNVRANRFETIVRPFCSACGETSGHLPFRCESDHNVSRVAEEGADGTESVPVVTLQEAVGNRPVHGIKVDVEGFELKVLRGAEEILRRSKPWLCVEFNPHLTGIKRLGDWDVNRFLTGLGYVCTEMTGFPGKTEARVLAADWETNGYCNLFYFQP